MVGTLKSSDVPRENKAGDYLKLLNFEFILIFVLTTTSDGPSTENKYIKGIFIDGVILIHTGLQNLWIFKNNILEIAQIPDLNSDLINIPCFKKKCLLFDWYYILSK